MTKQKLQTVDIWVGERSGYSVTKFVLNYSDELIILLKVNIEVKCIYILKRTETSQCKFNVNYGYFEGNT